MNYIPRPEYPRPQFVRPSWMNLNGTWQFEIDHGASGRARGLVERELNSSILVPFCPESKLSTVEYTDFMAAVWYRRTFTMPEEAAGKRVLLHFGAVDYKCEAWVNGVSVGVHEGGYTSFTFEITSFLKPGENTLVVCADDDLRSGRQPAGKQSDQYASYGCAYTRTTGIWQTVWIEWVEQTYINYIRMTPDAQNGVLFLDAEISGPTAGVCLEAKAFFAGEFQGEGCVEIDAGHARLAITLKDKKLWNVGQPNLYDLKLALRKNGEQTDAAESYFGLRNIAIEGHKCLINGKPVFQRLVLDQGYYPEGVYTAPTDEDLRRDIELSMAMGFNGARLHQKVFEQRYLYWADKLGYIVWGEMASWGPTPTYPHVMGIFMREWLEVVRRDINAPSIVGWCPFNEVWCRSWRRPLDGVCENTMQMTYRVTKAIDPTRPCIDTSGGWHIETDIFDTHDYLQDPDEFAERYKVGAPLYDRWHGNQRYSGGPFFVSEYGGTLWAEDASGWGYGDGPKTKEEFIQRYNVLTTTLLQNPDHMGFCYTQLTDVEQEQNGLYTYDRKPKFPPEVIAQINSQKAAIED